MFIESVIIAFKQKDSNVDMKEYIIPPYLFEVQKSVILFEIYDLKIKILCKWFIKKFLRFINNTFDVKINWLTRKMRTLVQWKDKSLHPSCKIYEGICSCSESYVGETITNIKTRQWA